MLSNKMPPPMIIILAILLLITSINSSHASIEKLLNSVADIKQRITNDAINWEQLIKDANANGANIYLVDSFSELKERSDNAQPGDIIRIKNGTYKGWEPRITTSGTKDKPIIYTAETPGRVIFKDDARIRITGQHNIVGGFVFEDVKTGNIIDLVGASNNRVTDNKFYNCGKSPKARIIAVADGSHHNRIDHNLMDNNQAFGMVITLSSRVAVSQYNRFDHNTFQEIHSDSIFEKVALQIGQDGSKRNLDYSTYTLVDNNQFLNVKSNNINSKSNYEYYIDNFFSNSSDLIVLSLRAGNHKYVEGNYFSNTHTAIRVTGSHHAILNNIIINASGVGIAIPCWGWVEKPDGNPPAYYRESRDIIVSNNLIHTQNIGVEIGKKRGYPTQGLQYADNPPARTVVVNNILIGKSENLYDLRSSIDSQFKNNHLIQ